MSQTQEKVTQKIESASDENLPVSAEPNAPAEKGKEFLDLAKNKVELDLEDAPFLNEEPEEQEQVAEEKAEQAAESKSDKQQEEVKPKSKKKLFLIGGGVAVLLLAVIGFFVYDIFFTEEPILQNVIVISSPEVRTPPKVHEFKLDPFVVQCVDSSGKIHFLKGSFILSTGNFEVFHEISNNQKVLRDAIYYYLEIQDPEILLNSINHQQIKKGLLDTVNKYVMNGSVDDLFIDSLLVF